MPGAARGGMGDRDREAPNRFGPGTEQAMCGWVYPLGNTAVLVRRLAAVRAADAPGGRTAGELRARFVVRSVSDAQDGTGSRGAPHDNDGRHARTGRTPSAAGVLNSGAGNARTEAHVEPRPFRRTDPNRHGGDCDPPHRAASPGRWRVRRPRRAAGIQRRRGSKTQKEKEEQAVATVRGTIPIAVPAADWRPGRNLLSTGHALLQQRGGGWRLLRGGRLLPAWPGLSERFLRPAERGLLQCRGRRRRLFEVLSDLLPSEPVRTTGIVHPVWKPVLPLGRLLRRRRDLLPTQRDRPLRVLCVARIQLRGVPCRSRRRAPLYAGPQARGRLTRRSPASDHRRACRNGQVICRKRCAKHSPGPAVPAQAGNSHASPTRGEIQRGPRSLR